MTFRNKEKEIQLLSQLYIDLNKVQDDFSEILPPFPEKFTKENVSEDIIDLYNKFTALIENVEGMLRHDSKVNTFDLDNI
jgi:hypothetical protein